MRDAHSTHDAVGARMSGACRFSRGRVVIGKREPKLPHNAAREEADKEETGRNKKACQHHVHRSARLDIGTRKVSSEICQRLVYVQSLGTAILQRTRGPTLTASLRLSSLQDSQCISSSMAGTY